MRDPTHAHNIDFGFNRPLLNHKRFASNKTREIINLKPKIGPIRDQGNTSKRPRNYFAKRIYLYGFQTIHGEKAIQEALDKKLPVMCCIAAYESLASYKGVSYVNDYACIIS
ncbi:unnamed protein product [Prunus armeniaca]|uniref:Uncharacterized protein n=1 Tax=Prunus armeniaca TaxID=36596 RepID=A0A6J5XJX5_PRUAR|nr:unnamed protein product [Prunus armeniaca]